MARAHVLVIGGGIGGIATAQLLAKYPHLQVTLYERDAGPSTRDQGLAIGLRQEAIDILTKDLEWPHLADLFSPDGANDMALMSASSSSTLLLVRNAMSIQLPPDGRVASSLVSRSDLRNAMMDSLAKNKDTVSIHYSKQVVSYIETNDKVVVTCADGTSAEYDCVVGADGARSRVRAQRCPALEPVELGYWTDAGSYDVSNPDELAATNPVFACARSALLRKSGRRGVSFLCFVFGRQRLLWSVSMPQSVADDHQLHSSLDAAAMREATVRLATDCFDHDVAAIVGATPLPDMFPGYSFFSVLPETVAANPLGTALTSRVTLLGDAAHKTTTQAGLGATAALKDAVLIATTLGTIQDATNVPAALRRYEVSMSRGAKAAVAMSVGNTHRIHNTNAFAGWIFTCMIGAMGWLLQGYNWCKARPSSTKHKQQ